LSLAKALQRGEDFRVMDAQPTPLRQLNGGSIGPIDAPQHVRGRRPVQEKIKLLVIVMVAAGAPLVVDTVSHEDVSFGCGCPPRLMLNPKDDARRAPARWVFSIAGAGIEPFIEMVFADADSADAHFRQPWTQCSRFISCGLLLRSERCMNVRESHCGPSIRQPKLILLLF
jgi:hypothetical protein